MEEVPTIESTSSGECTISKQLVNPLNLHAQEEASSLTKKYNQQDSALVKNSNRSYSFALEHREKISVEKKLSGESTVQNRVRRDRSMIIIADKFVDADGKKTNTVVMVSSTL